MRREDARRLANLVICWSAWAGVMGLLIWITFWPPPLTVRWPGLALITLIGVAVTASLIRSRYKLADTIAEVLKLGVHLGREQQSKADNHNS